jgi:hypothetical protein
MRATLTGMRGKAVGEFRRILAAALFRIFRIEPWLLSSRCEVCAILTYCCPKLQQCAYQARSRADIVMPFEDLTSIRPKNL